MKKLKKAIALIMCLVTLLSMSGISVSAASSSSLARKLNSIMPIVTYASPLSGNSKVYAYSSSSLTTKQSSYYINSFTEQIVIREISSNGKAVKVTYPNSTGAYRTKWFKVDDILGLAKVDIDTFKATSSINVYRMKSSSNVTQYGTIAKNSNDTCYQFGTHKIGSKTYYSTAYKLSSSSKINGVNVKYKLGLTSSSGVASNKSTSGSKTNTLNTVASSTSKSYSISNNILTVNGVKMSEFTVGGKYTNGRYVTVNGKTVDMYAWECCGYARYIQYKLYGSHYFLNNSKFPNLAGSENVYPDANGYKKLITSAGLGAHIRTLGNGHSMIVIAVTATGFTVTDANSDWKNTIRVKTYTWDEYANSSYGIRGLDYIEIYKR